MAGDSMILIDSPQLFVETGIWNNEDEDGLIIERPGGDEYCGIWLSYTELKAILEAIFATWHLPLEDIS
jgi:hypothetical protein